MVNFDPNDTCTPKNSTIVLKNGRLIPPKVSILTVRAL
jgi:hypothetical protein